MSLQMNMKMDGVLGESRSYQHKGWFEVISWSWGMTSNRKSTQAADGDKTALNELSIIKYIGIDSGAIRLLFAQGNIIPKIEFSIRPVVGKREAATKYVHIVMEDAVIKSIVTGGGVEEDNFKEHITILFGRIRFGYSRETILNSDEVNEQALKREFGWNVAAGAEWEETK